MANKRIDYTIGFNVDKAGIKEATGSLKTITNSLKEVANINLTDFMQIRGNNNMNEAKALLNEIKSAAVAAGNALQASFNEKTNSYNVTKFNAALKESGFTFKDLIRLLPIVGTVGEKALSNISNSATQMKNTIQKTATIFDKFAETLGNTVRWAISSGIINSFSGGIQKAWDYAKKLDESLNNIRIVTGKSAADMEKFAKEANKAAKGLNASTTSYTNASLIYYQQGLGEADVQARAQTTIKAANVTGQSAAEVSEQLTAVWNGYKVVAEEAELYVDKLAAVAATTAADLQELSEGMSKVASAANAMGVDIDQLSAQLATIVSVTRQDASVVGTALKTIYSRMGDLKVDGIDEFGVTLGDVSSQLQQMGINVLDQEGNLRDMGTVIEEVAAKWGTWTRAQQQAAAVAIAGKRQYNNLIALFDNWNMYESSLSTSKSAEGTLEKQQKIYAESIPAMLEKLKAAAEGVKGALFDPESIKVITEVLSGLLAVIREIVEAFGGLKSILPLTLGILLKSDKVGGGLAQALYAIGEGVSNTVKAYKEASSVSKNIDQLSKSQQELNKSTVALAQSRKTSNQLFKQGLIDEDQQATLINYESALEKAIEAEKEAYQIQEQCVESNEDRVEAEKLVADAVEKRKQAEANLNNEMGKHKGKLVASETAKTASGILTAVAAANTLGSAIKGVKDSTKSTGEQILSLAMTVISVVAVLVPLITSAWKAIKTTGEGAGKGIKKAFGWISLVLEIIAIAVSLTVALVGLFKKESATEKASKNLEKARENAKKAREEYVRLNESLQTFRDTIDQINIKELELSSMVPGTVEYTKAIADLNAEILKLLDLYPTLSKYIEFKDGRFQFKEGAEAAVEAELQGAIANASNAIYTTQVRELEAKNAYIKSQYQDSKHLNKTFSNRGWLAEQLDLNGTFDGKGSKSYYQLKRGEGNVLKKHGVDLVLGASGGVYVSELTSLDTNTLLELQEDLENIDSPLADLIDTILENNTTIDQNNARIKELNETMARQRAAQYGITTSTGEEVYLSALEIAGADESIVSQSKLNSYLSDAGLQLFRSDADAGSRKRYVEKDNGEEKWVEGKINNRELTFINRRLEDWAEKLGVSIDSFIDWSNDLDKKKMSTTELYTLDGTISSGGQAYSVQEFAEMLAQKELEIENLKKLEKKVPHVVEKIRAAEQSDYGALAVKLADPDAFKYEMKGYEEYSYNRSKEYIERYEEALKNNEYWTQNPWSKAQYEEYKNYVKKMDEKIESSDVFQNLTGVTRAQAEAVQHGGSVDYEYTDDYGNTYSDTFSFTEDNGKKLYEKYVATAVEAMGLERDSEEFKTFFEHSATKNFTEEDWKDLGEAYKINASAIKEVLNESPEALQQTISLIINEKTARKKYLNQMGLSTEFGLNEDGESKRGYSGIDIRKKAIDMYKQELDYTKAIATEMDRAFGPERLELLKQMTETQNSVYKRNRNLFEYLLGGTQLDKSKFLNDDGSFNYQEFLDYQATLVSDVSGGEENPLYLESEKILDAFLAMEESSQEALDAKIEEFTYQYEILDMVKQVAEQWIKLNRDIYNWGEGISVLGQESVVDNINNLKGDFSSQNIDLNRSIEKLGTMNGYLGWEEWLTAYNDAAKKANNAETLNALVNGAEKLSSVVADWLHMDISVFFDDLKVSDELISDYNEKIKENQEVLMDNKFLLFDEEAGTAIFQYEKFWDVYKEDLTSAIETLDKMKETVLNLLDQWEKGLKEIQNTYDNVIDTVSDLNSIISSGINATKIMGGVGTSDNLGIYYDLLIGASEETYQLKQKKVQDLLATYQAAVNSKNQQLIQSSKEALVAATNELAEHAEEQFNLISNKFKDMTSKAIDDILGGEGAFAQLSTAWELEKAKDETFLDDVNAQYGIDNIRRNFENSINETDSVYAQNKLMEKQAEIQERLNDLRESGQKITQYDLDLANAEYELTLKQIALEEAQQVANKMKLVRDASGNYTYQYVQDQDAIATAEQELADAQNRLYNIEKDRKKELIDSYFSLMTEYQEKYAEAAATGNKELMDSVYDYYFGNEGILAMLKTQLDFIETDAENLNNLFDDGVFDFSNAIMNFDATGLQTVAQETKTEIGTLKDTMKDLWDSDSPLVSAVEAIADSIGITKNASTGKYNIKNADSLNNQTLLNTLLGNGTEENPGLVNTITSYMNEVVELQKELQPFIDKYGDLLGNLTETKDNTEALHGLTAAAYDLLDTIDGKADGKYNGYEREAAAGEDGIFNWLPIVAETNK